MLADLGTEPKFATNPERVSNRVALTGFLGTAIEGWTKHHILQALEAAVVSAGPVKIGIGTRRAQRTAQVMKFS